jgi:hypothetical protein
MSKLDKQYIRNTLFAFLSIIVLNPAFAAIEETSISNPGDTNLVRGNLLIEGNLSIFDTDGIGLVPPRANLNNQVRLSTNGTNDLLWNGNPLVNSTGTVNANSANFAGNVSAPTFIGDLQGNADTANSVNNFTGTVDLSNQVTGILPATNGGTGTSTSTGTGSLVLSDSPTLEGDISLGGALGLGQSNTCSAANIGEISYDSNFCRMQVCDGKDLIDPSGMPFGFQETRKVFVTSGIFNGNLGGSIGADAICRNAASAAGLNNPNRFLALISDNVRRARDIINGKFDYVRIDGAPVDFCDLWGGNIDNPILIAEDGRDISKISYPPNQFGETNIVGVWTGTASDGGNLAPAFIGAPAPIANCNNWTTNSGNALGLNGLADSVASDWVQRTDLIGRCFPFQQGCTPDSDIVSPKRCEIPQHIYCVER